MKRKLSLTLLFIALLLWSIRPAPAMALPSSSFAVTSGNYIIAFHLIKDEAVQLNWAALVIADRVKGSLYTILFDQNKQKIISVKERNQTVSHRDEKQQAVNEAVQILNQATADDRMKVINPPHFADAKAVRASLGEITQTFQSDPLFGPMRPKNRSLFTSWGRLKSPSSRQNNTRFFYPAINPRYQH